MRELSPALAYHFMGQNQDAEMILMVEGDTGSTRETTRIDVCDTHI